MDTPADKIIAYCASVGKEVHQPVTFEDLIAVAEHLPAVPAAQTEAPARRGRGK
jgi:hypothetical protein